MIKVHEVVNVINESLYDIKWDEESNIIQCDIEDLPKKCISDPQGLILNFLNTDLTIDKYKVTVTILEEE